MHLILFVNVLNMAFEKDFLQDVGERDPKTLTLSQLAGLSAQLERLKDKPRAEAVRISRIIEILRQGLSEIDPVEFDPRDSRFGGLRRDFGNLRSEHNVVGDWRQLCEAMKGAKFSTGSYSTITPDRFFEAVGSLGSPRICRVARVDTVVGPQTRLTIAETGPASQGMPVYDAMRWACSEIEELGMISNVVWRALQQYCRTDQKAPIWCMREDGASAVRASTYTTDFDGHTIGWSGDRIRSTLVNLGPFPRECTEFSFGTRRVLEINLNQDAL